MYILLLYYGFSNSTKFLYILFYILFIKINSLHFYRLPTTQVNFPVTRHGVEGRLDGVHDKRHLRLPGLRDDSYYSTWRQNKNSGARATWTETSAASCRQSWERLAPAWARLSTFPAGAGWGLVCLCVRWVADSGLGGQRRDSKRGDEPREFFVRWGGSPVRLSVSHLKSKLSNLTVTSIFHVHNFDG